MTVLLQGAVLLVIVGLCGTFVANSVLSGSGGRGTADSAEGDLRTSRSDNSGNSFNIRKRIDGRKTPATRQCGAEHVWNLPALTANCRSSYLQRSRHGLIAQTAFT